MLKYVMWLYFFYIKYVGTLENSILTLKKNYVYLIF